MDHSEAVGISISRHNIGVWLFDLFFLPGDHILSILLSSAPGFAQFIGVTAVGAHSLRSGILSGVVWVILVILTSIAYGVLHGTGKLITAHLTGAYVEVRDRARMVRRFLFLSVRYRTSRSKKVSKIDVGELRLDRLQTALLRSYLSLAPGLVFTASAAANALGLRTSQVQQALCDLRRLQLVEGVCGTGDDEVGYRLSQLGQHFLAAQMGTAST